MVLFPFLWTRTENAAGKETPLLSSSVHCSCPWLGLGELLYEVCIRRQESRSLSLLVTLGLQEVEFKSLNKVFGLSRSDPEYSKLRKTCEKRCYFSRSSSIQSCTLRSQKTHPVCSLKYFSRLSWQTRKPVFNLHADASSSPTPWGLWTPRLTGENFTWKSAAGNIVFCFSWNKIRFGRVRRESSRKHRE